MVNENILKNTFSEFDTKLQALSKIKDIKEMKKQIEELMEFNYNEFAYHFQGNLNEKHATK